MKNTELPRELPQGTVRKRIKKGEKCGEWEGIIAYYYETGETNAKGKPIKKQKQLSHRLGVKCYADKVDAKTGETKPDNRGEKTAQDALANWRADLIAAAERKQQEAEAAELARLEAEKAKAEAEERAKNDDSYKTVVAYINEYINQHEAARTIEPSTVRGYRSTLKLIGGKLGETTVGALKPSQVRKMETDLTQEGYSSSSVGKCHRLLKMCMEQAVNDDVLAKNPCRGVKPLKRQSAKPNALDTTTGPLVVAKLNESPTDTIATIAARIALYCGLRRGEICALRWKDVSLNRGGGTLRVCNAIGLGTGGSYEKATKTDKPREVPIPAGLSKRLAAWKARQAETALSLGVSDISDYYVIGNVKGGYCSPEYVTRAWAVLAERFGIVGTEGRIPTFHDLRHSYATIEIAEGVNVKTVAGNMGHASANMTLDVYASPDAEAQRKSADTIENALDPKPAEVVQIHQPTGTEG